MMGMVLLMMVMLVMPRQGPLIVWELFSWWRGSAEGWSTQETTWEGGKNHLEKWSTTQETIWEGGKE